MKLRFFYIPLVILFLSCKKEEKAINLATPILISPVEAYESENSKVVFKWQNVESAEKYRFQLFDHNLLEEAILDELVDSNSYAYEISLRDTTLYWRVQAQTGNNQFSSWSEVRTIFIKEISYVEPIQTSLIKPANKSTIQNLVEFQWEEQAEGLSYQLWISNTSSFSNLIADVNQDNISYTLNESLDDGTYYWKVRTTFGEESSVWSSTFEFTINNSPVIPVGYKLKKLNTSAIGFAEGPAWDGKSTLYFTNQVDDEIYKYTEDKGVQLFMSNAKAANGLMFNHAGKIVACQGDVGRLMTINISATEDEEIVAKYNGKRFNKTNDLVIDKKGGIYFTDPTWGQSYQDVMGVYYFSPDKEIIRLISDMNKPNGVILTRDEKTLYVNDSESKYVRAYDVLDDGSLANKRNFATLQAESNGLSGADGMAIDIAGNLFVTSIAGVQVFNAEGDALGIITTPGKSTNCTFGGADLKTLFITDDSNLHSISMNITGVYFPQEP